MASTTSSKATRQADGNAFAASAAGATPSQSTRAPPKVTPVPIPKPGSIPSVPGQVAQPSPSPAVPPTAANNPAPPSATPTVPVVAVHPQVEAIRPILQDGRVRSPLPGRLKGKVDEKNGTFGVMLMTGPSTNDIGKRDAEAKRASESTKLAAEAAVASGSGPVRRRFIRLQPEPPSSSPGAPPVPPPPPPFTGFTDAGIKQEQARLLTLLRSLNPVTVVDHICTALAFFGGIPGAPPPPGGAFPPSAMSNGSGRLFVSWLAEIFPPIMPSYPPPGPPPPALPVANVGPVMQPLPEPSQDTSGKKRGRPKGSKSSHPRKDKGVKKGPVWARPDTVPKPRTTGRPVGRPRKHPPKEAANPGDESWVDIDQDEEENEEGQAEAAGSASAAGPAILPSVRTALPSGNQGAEGEVITPRKRGRPKGSKTKRLQATPNVGAAPASASDQAPPAGRFTPVPQGTSSPAVTQTAANAASFTALNSASAAPPGPGAPEASEARTNLNGGLMGGRAKATKNKPKADQTASTSGAATQSVTDTPASAPVVSQAPAGYGDQPYITYPSAPVRTQQTIALTLPQSPPQPQAADPAPLVPANAPKRKRKSKNESQAIAQQALENAAADLPGNDGASQVQQQKAISPETTLASPPAKRQRSRFARPKAIPFPQPKANSPKASVNASPKAGNQASTVDTSSMASEPAQEPFEHTFDATTHASAQDPLSLDVDHAISSLQSPQEESHFDVDSPTMENYQAQLHAQLEQESSSSVSPSVTQQPSGQGRVSVREFMVNQMRQHNKMETHFPHNQQQQRQQPSSAAHQAALQVSQSSTAHRRSPSFQQQVTKPQQESPRTAAQSAVRPSQNNFQYRPTGAQFTNSPTYSPQQTVQPQFTATKQQNPQASQGQQYATNTAQQYNTTQSQYPGVQSQYSTGNQQQGATAQSRYPQQLVTTTGTGSYTAAATNNSYLSSSYSANIQRSATSNGYRSGGSGTSPTPQAQQQHQRSSSSTSSQGLQTNPLQSFSAGTSQTAGGWDMFDATNTNQGQGVNMAGYGAATARGQASGGSGFAGSSQGGMGGFEAGGGYWKRQG